MLELGTRKLARPLKCGSTVPVSAGWILAFKSDDFQRQGEVKKESGEGHHSSRIRDVWHPHASSPSTR